MSLIRFVIGVLSQDDYPAILVGSQSECGIDIFGKGIDRLVFIFFIEKRSQFLIVFFFKLFSDDLIPVIPDDSHENII